MLATRIAGNGFGICVGRFINYKIKYKWKQRKKIWNTTAKMRRKII